MKQFLKSLRIRMLLPVVAMTLFTVILLTFLFARGFIRMILQQENEVNTAGFDTVSGMVTPLIDTSVSAVRSLMADDRVASYAGLRYDSVSERIRARISCRDFLRAELARYDGIFGLLFMRKDGSLFGSLPEGNFFWDDPRENPLPEEVRSRILEAPIGQTVWIGPLSTAVIDGFESEDTTLNVMIAAWKSVDVRYGECYAMMLMDESIFGKLFTTLQDGKSSWHLFAGDGAEICHMGLGDACANPDLIIRSSNTGNIFTDEHGQSVCSFSMTLASPRWTLVRVVSMDSFEQVVHRVRRDVSVVSGIVFLIALVFYELWLRKFMRQYNSLQNGIVRIGQGNLDPIEFESSTISEFETMQQEINRTGAALSRQMDTIRSMEREQLEQEHRKQEQERIVQELSMAREIQANALPNVFPAFPDREEFSLFASMSPAKEVGGDFYDFFLVDSDHLALVIADVSGKGIPAALFMMLSKTLIKNELMNGCDPAKAMERVNLQLWERNSSRMFVTVWLAVLEISTGKGLACNAGHEHPALRRSGEPFDLVVYPHGTIAGISRKARYQNREFVLLPGDCVFVYTDGIPEATNGSREMFTEERLVAALNACPEGSSPEEILQTVKTAVNAFVGDAEQFDDLTMMCLKYRGPAS